ncbi:Bulb-type lectin domain-containing protein, partial [Cynara cardunculus var. scolymus]
MHFPFLFLSSLIIISYFPRVATAPSSPNVLTQGSSLFVENDDLLVSSNGVFAAGFHPVGENTYCFAIWFSKPMSDGNLTLVWMENRDKPVNGKRSKFSLWKTGNLVLTDAGRHVWRTDTISTNSQLKLLDSGNLVLIQPDDQSYLWQSFSFPTDTILSNQRFTRDSVLVSSRSSTNLSSGFYKLYFDDDNVIRLVYDSYEITSVYWPKPWLRPWDAMRSTFNNSRFALLDSKGQFKSTDNLTFITTDYGQIHHRRMTLDVDGNVRVYTLNKGSWTVSWQAISKMCSIHGICGPNSLCTYSFESGRRCTCMHGYKAKNHTDLSFGCEPIIKLTGHRENYEFIRLPHFRKT